MPPVDCESLQQRHALTIQTKPLIYIVNIFAAGLSRAGMDTANTCHAFKLIF